MKIEKGVRDEHVVDDRGKRASAAPKVAGGSIAVVIIAVIVSRLIGVDVTKILGTGDTTQPSSTQSHAPVGSGSAAEPSGPDPDEELVDLVNFAMKDIQGTFAAMYKAEGKEYRYATLHIFTDEIDTACGRSSSAIGPFYCPGDWNAYIDLSFYRDLRKRFGAPGDFAQAYVLAHEIGHHLQNLARSEGHEPACPRGENKNACSVHVELQADCYAGVWGAHAQNKKLLDQGDLEEAITAATAIGDDRLQKDAGMHVNPETFTHGTSAQRVAWFRRGFEAGTLDACNTYASALPPPGR